VGNREKWKWLEESDDLSRENNGVKLDEKEIFVFSNLGSLKR